jgi:hypothetical protein
LVAVNHCFTVSQNSFHCLVVVLPNASTTSGVAFPNICFILVPNCGTLVIHSNAEFNQTSTPILHGLGSFHSEAALIHNTSADHANILPNKLSNLGIAANSHNCAANLPAHAHFHSSL